ncbi:TPA: hypothetical protein DEB00_03400 [Candidatus Uhrbacteria bacterium]|nr:hypothetical protein [Candidatus Uhrbacteria bacterium]
MKTRFSSHRLLIITLIGTVFVAIADGIAKIGALSLLVDRAIPILPGVAELYLHKNMGVVANTPLPMLVVIPLTVIILVVCVVWLCHSWKTQHRLSVGLILLVGGATGNLLDRVVHGFTTDYLLLFGRSVINVSDVLIVLGILGILFSVQTTSPSKS